MDREVNKKKLGNRNGRENDRYKSDAGLINAATSHPAVRYLDKLNQSRGYSLFLFS